MSKKQLIVDIDSESVRFTRLDGVTVEKEFHFKFKDKSDFAYKDQLDLFLTKSDFRSLEWDEFSLSWFSEKSSLMPFAIFNESNYVKIFELAYGNSTDEKNIDFNRIPEFSVVNIYEIPMWVKSFFVTRFPRMVLQHEGSHAIRGLISGAGFGLNILISLHENQFLLLATYQNELKYYNTFEYHTAEDIVYHTAHVLQQNNWQNTKGKLRFVPSIQESDEKADQAREMLQNLAPFQHLIFEDTPYLLSQFQILCV